MTSAHEIAAGFLDAASPAGAALEQSLRRIEAVEAQVEAWAEVDAAAARRQAEGLEARRRAGSGAGSLAGVPAGIKDIVDVEGFTTRAGAPAFAHRTPGADATAVRRLREAGAIILGKTHTTEFAYLDPAPTRNPWNLKHTPGGSSSGSAAAVAAGMAALAIGSQTVGSVLRPAGYCGIVGLKPSFGRISYTGVYALAPSFDHLGLLVTCVRDAALGLSSVAGFDSADPNSLDAPPEDYLAAIADPHAPRLGVPAGYFRGFAEAETEAHLQAVARKLTAAGAHVIEVDFGATASEIAEAAMPVMRYEAARAHGALYAENRDSYRPSIRSLIEAGIATSEADYNAGRGAVAALRERQIALLEDVDAILLPTAPGPAPASLSTTGPGIFCGPASFTGLPSISLPSGIALNGLPFSVQLIGPAQGESKLLNTAAWLEGVLDFHARPRLDA